MTMIPAICAIVACFITVAGVLIYIGKSINSLQRIDANQEVLFKMSRTHTADIARIDKELVQVKTRQEDCSNCP